MNALLAAIPPPPFSEFHLGPLTIRMYGIMIGLGVLAATWLCGRLMTERNVGDTDDAAAIAVWGVVFGVIGARLYHVVTDFELYRNNLIEIPMVWKPGLGIPGGILFGAIAGVVVCRRRGIPVLPALSCAAPAIPLAQSIGRWGNYFNQELYGRETTLPWGLEVDAAHRVAAAGGADVLYHPTFLYESLWNLGLCLALVWVFRNVRLQPGRLFPLYMIGYGLGRLWIEALRIDPANTIGPFRVNIWMSIFLIGGGATWFILSRNSTARWPRPAAADGTSDAAGDDTSADDGDEDANDAKHGSVRSSATGTARDGEGPSSADADSSRDDASVDAAAGGDVDEADKRPIRTAATKRSGTTKSVTTKTAAKKTAEKKPTTKNTAVREAAEAQAAPDPAAKKTAAKKPAANKSAAKESAVKERAAKESAAKKSVAKKSVGSAAGAAESAAKKAVAKKSPVKKSPVKKPAAKKSVAKRSGDDNSTDD